jgi:NAD(P)H-hydrate epimerase
MRYLVSGKEMKAIDKRTIEEFGIPSMVLMERAALAVFEEAERLLRESGGKTVWAVCGPGNNGADGIAAARMLFLHGFDVMILLPGGAGKTSTEFESQLAIAKKLGLFVSTSEDYIPGTCDLVIDALFGIGLSRELSGVYAELVEMINSQSGAKVVSVDIPSGINSDTGAVMGQAVTADVTVTFGEIKLGHILFPGREHAGRLVVADVGFVPEDLAISRADDDFIPGDSDPSTSDGGSKSSDGIKRPVSHVLAYEPADLKRIPERKRNSNKGTFGKVLVIAGAKNMAGAAYLSALAAYRTGAGLVKVFTPEENRLVIQTKLPEAILSTYDTEWAGAEPEEFSELVMEQTGWADVIVLGPGLGQEEYAKNMVETVLSDAYVPIIMDADAINLAAENEYLKGYFTENIILTPHVMEMSRLAGKTVGEIKADPVKAASEFSERYGLTCVLKDAATVTAGRDGKVFVNMSGTPAMAKGGSGDVLTGVIAGLIAIGMEECDAASLGVYVHGLAGEKAEAAVGTHSVLAGELADHLMEVINVSV